MKSDAKSDIESQGRPSEQEHFGRSLGQTTGSLDQKAQSNSKEQPS